MRGALFAGNRRISLTEFPIPEPHDDWVLVRVKASALCGTDLPYYRADATDPLDGCIPGHEIAGQVAEVDRPLHIKRGDRVVVNTQVGCGRCQFCRTGSVLFCPEMRTAGLGEGLHGGQADYLLVPEKDCLPLPDDISYAVGSVIPDGAGVAFHLLNRMGGVGGLDRTAVFGAGPIGLGIVAMLKHMGAAEIVVSEPLAYRRDLARRLGATHTVDPTTDDPVAFLLDITSGAGADKVIDAASHTDVTINHALASVRRGGTVGLIGQKDSVRLSNYTHHLIHKELRLISSCGYNLGEYETLVEAVRDGLALSTLITHEYPLEEIQTAFQVFDSGETGKVVIVRD